MKRDASNMLIPWWDSSGADRLPLIPKGGLEVLRVPMSLSAHAHRGHEISFLLKGEAHWQVEGGSTLRLAGGDVALTQPQVMHSGELEIIQPCVLLWMVVHPWVDEATAGTPLRPADVAWIDQVLCGAGNCVVRATPAMIATARNLQALLPARDVPRTPAFRVWLHTLLVQFLLAAVESFQAHGTATLSPPIAAAVAYLHAHDTKACRMRDVARHIDLSPSRFYQRFKAEVGLTPVDYLTRLRVQRARAMLANPEWSITDIAYELSFVSSQYFAHTFRKYTGVTPTAYRARLAGTPSPPG